jgi:hypothetical protein
METMDDRARVHSGSGLAPSSNGEKSMREKGFELNEEVLRYITPIVKAICETARKGYVNHPGVRHRQGECPGPCSGHSRAYGSPRKVLSATRSLGMIFERSM